MLVYDKEKNPVMQADTHPHRPGPPLAGPRQTGQSLSSARARRSPTTAAALVIRPLCTRRSSPAIFPQ